MTRYEWFENGYGLEAVTLGIVGAGVFMKYIRYKIFLEFTSAGVDKITAIELTAERNKCDRSTIYRDIEWFAK